MDSGWLKAWCEASTCRQLTLSYLESASEVGMFFQVVDGSGSFSFRKTFILQLFKDSFQYVSDPSILYKYGYKLVVNATFHEDLTGKVASSQGSISFYEMDVKLKFAEFNPQNFKPGLPFKALVSLTWGEEFVPHVCHYIIMSSWAFLSLQYITKPVNC